MNYIERERNVTSAVQNLPGTQNNVNLYVNLANDISVVMRYTAFVQGQVRL